MLKLVVSRVSSAVVSVINQCLQFSEWKSSHLRSGMLWLVQRWFTHLSHRTSRQIRRHPRDRHSACPVSAPISLPDGGSSSSPFLPFASSSPLIIGQISQVWCGGVRLWRALLMVAVGSLSPVLRPSLRCLCSSHLHLLFSFRIHHVTENTHKNNLWIEFEIHGNYRFNCSNCLAFFIEYWRLQTIESELELTQREGEKSARMRGYHRRVSSLSFVLFNLFLSS